MVSSGGLRFFLACELHQVSLDKFIDVTVHYGGDIRSLIACSVVFYATVIKDIATDLSSPFDFLLACFYFGLSLATTLQLLIIELRAE